MQAWLAYYRYLILLYSNQTKTPSKFSNLHYTQTKIANKEKKKKTSFRRLTAQTKNNVPPWPPGHTQLPVSCWPLGHAPVTSHSRATKKTSKQERVCDIHHWPVTLNIMIYLAVSSAIQIHVFLSIIILRVLLPYITLPDPNFLQILH